MTGVQFVIVWFCLFKVCVCWVFTEVKYEKQMRGDSERFDWEDDADYEGRFNLLYPGTKWCGPGDMADSYDDLGTSVEADKCCRQHDNCPTIIASGETKHNLTNEAFYTRLSCDCDETFRQCMRSANTKAASQIGVLYFNVIGTKCFRKDYPVTGCAKRSGWLHKKCVEYTYNKDGEMIYQWFDVPSY